MSNRGYSPREEDLDEHTSESEYTSDKDQLDDDLQFYDRKKRPSQKVCPFSDPCRTNPCPDYDRPRTRKDSIMKHLLKVQNSGGDSHHPLTDPLWEGFAVKYFLSRRPAKLDPKKRKSAKQASQSKYYKKRKRIQKKNLESMQQLFDEGKISEEEFKKILVGEKRRLFITSRRLEVDFNKRVEREVEQRIRAEVDAKLTELNARLVSSQDPIASAADAASIQALRAAQKELDDTREALNDYQEMLFHKSEDVVQFYAENAFLPSNISYLEYHGFHWPAQASCPSFYVFATILVPISSWKDTASLHSGSNIRFMALRLSEYIRLEKENVDEDEHGHLEGIYSTFNASCDLVTAEAKKTESMSAMGREAWVVDQEKMWEAAKEQFHFLFRFNSHAPIQHIKVIDDLADIWRMRNAAELDNRTAVANAQEAAQCV
jgi:hypothetical protein